jgi:profilin-like protein
MSSWDEVLQNGISPFVGALGNATDCSLYAAAPVNAGWQWVWSEPHTQQIEVDTDRFEPLLINESQFLHHALTTGQAPYGIWLGKNKFKLVQYDKDFDLCGRRVTLLFATRPKGGVHVVCTTNTVLIGMYDEEQPNMTSRGCRTAVLKFAEYLLDNGY